MSSDLRRLRYARGHRTRNKTGRGRQVIHSAFLASCGSNNNNNNNLTTMTWPKSGMWLSKRTLQPMWGTLTSLFFKPSWDIWSRIQCNWKQLLQVDYQLNSYKVPSSQRRIEAKQFTWSSEFWTLSLLRKALVALLIICSTEFLVKVYMWQLKLGTGNAAFLSCLDHTKQCNKCWCWRVCRYWLQLNTYRVAITYHWQ